LPSDI
jgi:serine/threonine protein kinase